MCKEPYRPDKSRKEWKAVRLRCRCRVQSLGNTRVCQQAVEGAEARYTASRGPIPEQASYRNRTGGQGSTERTKDLEECRRRHESG